MTVTLASSQVLWGHKVRGSVLRERPDLPGKATCRCHAGSWPFRRACITRAQSVTNSADGPDLLHIPCQPGVQVGLWQTTSQQDMSIAALRLHALVPCATYCALAARSRSQASLNNQHIRCAYRHCYTASKAMRFCGSDHACMCKGNQQQ